MDITRLIPKRERRARLRLAGPMCMELMGLASEMLISWAEADLEMARLCRERAASTFKECFDAYGDWLHERAMLED